jgi:hypothetical protein
MVAIERGLCCLPSVIPSIIVQLLVNKRDLFALTEIYMN